jgi:hypothetical protein
MVAVKSLAKILKMANYVLVEAGGLVGRDEVKKPRGVYPKYTEDARFRFDPRDRLP